MNEGFKKSMKPTQKTITKYVSQAIKFPMDKRELLDGMVMLHYDLSPEITKDMVTKAIKIIHSSLKLQHITQFNELKATERYIKLLESFVPELGI